MNIKPLLTDVGLTDNEVAVYVALLSASPTTVQLLARKAGIPRATVYAVLESLTHHDLITKYKESKKTLIAAQPPRYLFRFIERQEQLLQRRRVDLEHAVPLLHAIMKTNHERTFVRPFSGSEAIQTLQNEMLMRSVPGDTWHVLVPLDAAGTFFAEKTFFGAPRSAKRISLKLGFTTESSAIAKKILSRSPRAATEYLHIPSSAYPSTVGLLISRDQVVFVIFDTPPHGLVVENQLLVDALRDFFLLIWRRHS